MQAKLAPKDILSRGSHNNPFHLKLPSHNASKQSIVIMSQTFILNKLALLPFQQDQKLVQLFKVSLQQLLELPLKHYKDQVFVMELLGHIENWEKHMKDFGTWPYTRAALYSVEEKVKKNQVLWEKVILRRGLLEPNKAQFLNKAQTQSFKNPELISYIASLARQSRQDKMTEQHEYKLPEDILFQDSDYCWKALSERHKEFNQDRVQEYLEEYMMRGPKGYVQRSMRQGKQNEQILEGLELRSSVYRKIIGKDSSYMRQMINAVRQHAQKQ